MRKISYAALVAAVLTFGSPVASAMAEDISLSVNENWTDITNSGVAFSYEVPQIITVESSMDEAAIREMMTGKYEPHMTALAALNAKSIQIPEVKVSGKKGGDTFEAVFRDFALEGVVAGQAAKVSLGGISVKLSGTSKADIDIGALTLDNFDIGRLLAIQGFVPPLADQDFHTVLTGGHLEGATVKSDAADCTIGGYQQGATAMQQPGYTYKSFIDTAMPKGGATPNEDEALVATTKYYAALLPAQRSEGGNFAGFKCDGQGTEMGTTYGIDGFSIGATEPGIYPEFKINGIAVATPSTGTFNLAEFVFKPIDFAAPIKAIEALGDNLTAGWIKDNYRLLVPAFGGLSFSGVAANAPRPDDPTKTMPVKLAEFDLSLADYINGIPSKVTSFARGLEAVLPQDSTDPQIGMLLASGLTSVNLGYDIGASWDGESKSIVVDTISVAGKDLGSLMVAANLGNAADEIFATNSDAAMAALMGVTVKSLNIDLLDAGLGDIAIPIFAGPQGADPKSFRQQMAGSVEGMVIVLLGATDSARQLGAAIGNFVNGSVGSVSVAITANDPLGIPIPELMQASENPALLGSQVTITGTGK